jgi:hypothetical protein
MSLALTNLDITTLTIGGTSYLRNAEGVSFDFGFPLDDAHGIAMRHKHRVATKRRNTFTVPMFRFTNSRPRTNLDVSLFDFGTEELIGDLKSGSIRISTDVEDGSALADGYTFPVPVGTNVEVSGSLLVRGGAELAILDAIGDGALTDLEVAMAVTIDGIAFAMPMVVSSAALSKQRGALQKYDITMEPQATMTSNYGITQDMAGVALMQSIISGSAFVAFSVVTTDGLTLSGNAILLSGECTFDDQAVVRDSFEFEVQGALTVSETT